MSKLNESVEGDDNTASVDAVDLTSEEVAEKEAEREAAQVVAAEVREAGNAEKSDSEATAAVYLEEAFDGNQAALVEDPDESEETEDSEDTADSDETEDSEGTDDLDAKAKEVIDTLEGGGKMEDLKESLTELWEYLKKYVSGALGMTALGDAMSPGEGGEDSLESSELNDLVDPSAPIFSFASGVGVSPRISSGQGERTHNGETKSHDGVDVAGVPEGTVIHSTVEGEIIKSDYSPTNGNYVAMRTPDGHTHYFLHLKNPGVAKGTKIKPGDSLGRVGNTGRSRGAHLHYTAYKPGKMGTEFADVENANFLSSSLVT
ncbi:MAG: murein DD-endopeptidase MepM/ murein hydrolase activator NlpD [Oceanicoccus sp.]|jgi:murein DD-endopeptidase MepM/ murein hydrolase activator NlpD